MFALPTDVTCAPRLVLFVFARLRFIVIVSRSCRRMLKEVTPVFATPATPRAWQVSFRAFKIRTRQRDSVGCTVDCTAGGRVSDTIGPNAVVGSEKSFSASKNVRLE